MLHPLSSSLLQVHVDSLPSADDMSDLLTLEFADPKVWIRIAVSALQRKRACGGRCVCAYMQRRAAITSICAYKVVFGDANNMCIPVSCPSVYILSLLSLLSSLSSSPTIVRTITSNLSRCSKTSSNPKPCMHMKNRYPMQN